MFWKALSLLLYMGQYDVVLFLWLYQKAAAQVCWLADMKGKTYTVLSYNTFFDSKECAGEQ